MEEQEVISEFWAAFLAADEERLAAVVGAVQWMC